MVIEIMALYVRTRLHIKTAAETSEELDIGVGIYQGSVFFILVMDKVTTDIRKGVPWDSLYADDLNEGRKCWKNLGMERKNGKNYLK